MKYYIYTLECPETGEIRYVGKTNNLKTRLSGHKNSKKDYYKDRWVRSLSNLPVISTIDECNNEDEAYNLEIYWIAQFKAWGFNLTNLSVGGRGLGKENVVGENNGHAKITEAIAKSIIYDLQLDIYTLSELCVKYNVGLGTLTNIKYGKSWSHLTGGKPIVSSKYKQKESGKLNRAKSLRDKGVYKSQSISVIQMDMNGKEIQSFESIQEASDKTNTNRTSISQCLNDLQRSANKFKWKKNNIINSLNV